MPIEEQVVSIYLGVHGHLDSVEVKRVVGFAGEFLRVMRDKHSRILSTIREEKALSPETSKALDEAIAEFKRLFS